ncbi:MAG: PQQ-dependent sugar dehydrogenase [Cyclobacteriaceae bacterium]
MRFYQLHLYTFLFLSLIALTACFQENPDEDPEETGNIQLIEAFPNLSFERPVDFQHAREDSDRIFVVEQSGLISVFQNESETDDKGIFLDIRSQVEDSGNEEGLLGLAFHPDYENNGYFYVNYTALSPDRTVISRFQVSASDPGKANQGSELVLLEFNQPYSNHNGGQLSFGPDGFLYIAVGDGGSGGDPQENGQDPRTLLGTILRIDVDNASDGRVYGIPPDNPFADNEEGYREEIYAYGLRNPWRFSFDSESGILWAADVGQNRYEEIDIIENGGNYGWNIMEGFHCFEPESDCEMDGLEMPIWEYDRSEGDISVTGGFVYRGAAISQLEGLYVYGDYASGRIWTLDFSDLDHPVNEELIRAPFSISSFGVDQDNELYVCGFDGKIYRFTLE